MTSVPNHTADQTSSVARRASAKPVADLRQPLAEAMLTWYGHTLESLLTYAAEDPALSEDVKTTLRQYHDEIEPSFEPHCEGTGSPHPGAVYAVLRRLLADPALPQVFGGWTPSPIEAQLFADTDAPLDVAKNSPGGRRPVAVVAVGLRNGSSIAARREMRVPATGDSDDIEVLIPEGTSLADARKSLAAFFAELDERWPDVVATPPVGTARRDDPKALAAARERMEEICADTTGYGEVRLLKPVREAV